MDQKWKISSKRMNDREQRSCKEYYMFTLETVSADNEGDNTASDPSY